jgi:hypothetical protein
MKLIEEVYAFKHKQIVDPKSDNKPLQITIIEFLNAKYKQRKMLE